MLADMPKVTESVGKRLRRSREAHRPTMSQTALAKIVGVTRSAISQCELGMTNSLTAEGLIRAAIALGKSPLWLATGEGPERDPGAFGGLLAALPDEQRRAVLDFAMYHIDKAAPIIGPNAGNYASMIERIRSDFETKAAPAAKAPDAKAKAKA